MHFVIHFLSRRAVIGVTNCMQLGNAGIQIDGTHTAATGGDNKVHVGEKQPAMGSSRAHSSKKSFPKYFWQHQAYPTVSHTLKCTWDFDFIEMEEFLPSNKMMRAL